MRIDQRENDAVTARVVVWNVRARRAAAQIKLGQVRTGRVLRVAWPRKVRLRAGRYLVRVHAKDGRGAPLARSARASGKAPLTVTAAPKPKRRPKPAPPKQPTPPPVAPSVPGGGVFPVAGSYTLSGPDGSFGADRGSHAHEGHDITAAAGTPIVAPVAGVVAFTDYQASGAGHYVVLNADDGRSMFFAHCQSGSTAVSAGVRVSRGQPPLPRRQHRPLDRSPPALRDLGRRLARPRRPPGRPAPPAPRLGLLAPPAHRACGATLLALGEIAQLVEHTTENRGVPGSSPGLAIPPRPRRRA